MRKVATLGILIGVATIAVAAVNSQLGPTAPSHPVHHEWLTSSDVGHRCDLCAEEPIREKGATDVLTWVSVASIPCPVSRTAGVFDSSGKFHLICGNCNAHTSHPTDQIYDVTSNSWTTGLTHPAGTYGVHNHDAAIIHSKIYVGGGSSGPTNYNNLTCIDLIANTWTVVGPMPRNSWVYYTFAVGNNGRLYAFGGDSASLNYVHNETWEFNPATATWTRKADMPAVRRSVLTATWGDTIYVIGGCVSTSYLGLNTLWKYSVSGNTWTVGTPAPDGIAWGRASVWNDPALGPIIYCCGGYNASGTVTNAVYAYSIRTGTWTTETPMLTARRSHAGDISPDVFDGRVLLMAGGWNSSGGILGAAEKSALSAAQPNDVGVASITVPGFQVTPGTPVTPTGVVTNYGTQAQSYIPVYCWIDSAGVRIYQQNITLPGPINPGGSANATFPSWTPGTSPAYRVTMFTNLSNDQNRANDTAKKTTTTWVNITPCPDSTDRIVHATVYDPVNDKLYMIGGNRAGASGTYVNLCHRYDPTSNTWQRMADMPTARGWIKGSYCNGKIYVIGGHNNAGAAIATNECYDIAQNSWTTVAPRPRVALADMEVVWRDQLIYCLGGTDGTNGLTNVDIYDPATNTWSTGTPLPFPADMGGAAIIGDTIYITNAVNRSTSTPWANLYKGYINPSNPTNISWIAGPTHAQATSITGAAAIGSKVYWFGGFVNLSMATDQGWVYDQATGTISTFPAPYPATISRNHFLVARPSAGELYGLAGDSGCNWAAPNRKYVKINVGTPVTPMPDIAITNLAIDDSVPFCVPETIRVTVQNIGTATAEPPWWLKLDVANPDLSHYYDSLLITETFNPSQSRTYEFVWHSPMPCRHVVLVNALYADSNGANNSRYKIVYVRSKDAEIVGTSIHPNPPYLVNRYVSFDVAVHNNSRHGWNPLTEVPVVVSVTKPDASTLVVDSIIIPSIAFCETVTVWTDSILLDQPGTWRVTYEVPLPGDNVPANNSSSSSFLVSRVIIADTGWASMLSVPAGPKGKGVKDGGCLTYCARNDTDYVYVLKGNGRYEFYRFNTNDNTWATLESIPAIGSTGKKKAPKKGAAMAECHQTGKIYVVKGNGTLEFWEYDPVTNSWTEKAAVPTGGKAIKEGSGMVSVQIGETNYIYLLKGSGTQEYYRYNTVSNAWETMEPAPLGTSGKPYKNGSCLTTGIPTEPDTVIWALKGSLNEFYAYSVTGNAWTTKAPLPLIGASGKKKKVKDGAGIAYHNKTVYALKGGNTNEFWSYSCDSDKWTQLPDMPAGAGKNVKGGGALVYAASRHALYALKGNNTLEFYRYGLSCIPAAGGVAAANAVTGPTATVADFALRITPNPFSGAALISYSLPVAGNVSLKLYDVTGKLVTTLVSGYHNAGSYVVHLVHHKLASGVYLMKLETGNATATAKLITE